MGNPSLALPTAFQFRQPLVMILGWLSCEQLQSYGPNDMQAGVGISNRMIEDILMQDRGFDLRRVPKSRKGKGSVRQRVKTAFHQLKNPQSQIHTLQITITKHLTVKGPLTMSPKRGFWALTEAGVRLARRLCGVQNLTSYWIGRHKALYDRSVLAVASKMTKSRQMGIVEDHVQEVMMKWIRRDTFRKRIVKKGKVPTPGECAAWAVNSAITEIRDAGQDAHCRGAWGALTEQNRREMEDSAPTVQESHHLQGTSTVQFDGEGLIIDYEDEVAIGPDANLDAASVMAQVEEVLQRRRPRAWERDTSLTQFLLKEDGATARDVAKEFGVSKNRAATMIGKVRRVLKDERERGRIAL